MLLNDPDPIPDSNPASSEGPDARRRRLWTATAILCAAALLRLVALDSIPPGLQHDEVFKTIFVEQVRAGQYPIFFDLNGGNEPFFAYLVTISLALFGDNVVALRLPAAAGGLLGIAALWSLAQGLWGRWAAALATLLASVSFWHLMDSRVSLRAIWLPAFMTLSYLLLWRGIRRGQQRWYVAGGILLGLSLYTYTSSLLGVVTVILFALWTLAQGRRAVAANLLLAAGLALALGAPLAWHWLREPEAGTRVRDLSHELVALREGDPLPALRSAVRVAGMFAFVGDPEWRYNIAGRPVFLAPFGFAFYLGLWLCWRRRADPAYVFLAVWAVANLGASAVTSGSPSTLRAVGAMPAAFVLAAIGGLAAHGRLARRAGRPWATAALGLAFLLEAGLGLHGYFYVWPAHPEVREIYRADLAEIARALGREDAQGASLVSSEFAADLDRLSFEYLGFTSVRPRYFDGANTLLFPAEPATIFLPASRMLSGPLRAVLQARGSLLEQMAGFQAWVVPAAAPGEDPWLAEVEATWPGPALQVWAVDLPAVGHAGSAVEVTVRYRVSAPAPGGHVVTLFAHLKDQAGFRWAQVDALTYPSSDWRLSDDVYQTLTLQLPADMPDVTTSVDIGFYEDASRPYLLHIGADRSAFDRLSAGTMAVQGVGAPLESLAPDVSLKGSVPLVGASVGPRVVQPGQDLEVSLWWQATDLGGVGPIEAKLTGPNTVQVLETEAASGAGMAPSGAVFRQRVRFTVPRDTPRGEWSLTLRPSGLGRDVSLGAVFVGGVDRTYESPVLAGPTAVEFGGQARLAGSATAIGSVSRGSVMEAALIWEALAPFTRDLTVFVHLVDGEGRVWAAHDGVPAGGSRPTRGWLAGEVIVDAHPIAVPADAPPGGYRLIAGLYDSNQVGYPRLPVTSADTEAGADWALIAEVEVVE